MRYFELYVGGKHGYSTYVKTDKTSDTELVIELAVNAGVISGPDAGDIIRQEEESYCKELTELEIAEAAPRLIHEI